MKNITVVRKDKFLLRGDIWFDGEPEEIANGVDVLYYYYQTTKPPTQNIEFDEEYTILLDLTKEQDEIWKNLSKNNRYEIRRASQKDQVIYELLDDINSNVINIYFDFYDQFALQKGLRKLSKSDRARLISYANAGVLRLSHVKLKDGNTLTWHAYCCSKNRVFLLHSASIKNPNNTAYQSLLGRANRYHHWQDIVKFKNLGVSLYDFGHFHAGTTDYKLLNLDQFKEGFGGQIFKHFNWRHGITINGKLFLRLRKILVFRP